MGLISRSFPTVGSSALNATSVGAMVTNVVPGEFSIAMFDSSEPLKSLSRYQLQNG